MVKKGFESNIVGKKKKETGQISINTHKKDKIKKKKMKHRHIDTHTYTHTYIHILCPTKSVHDLIV